MINLLDVLSINSISRTIASYLSLSDLACLSLTSHRATRLVARHARRGDRRSTARVCLEAALADDRADLVRWATTGSALADDKVGAALAAVADEGRLGVRSARCLATERPATRRAVLVALARLGDDEEVLVDMLEREGGERAGGELGRVVARRGWLRAAQAMDGEARAWTRRRTTIASSGNVEFSRWLVEEGGASVELGDVRAAAAAGELATVRWLLARATPAGLGECGLVEVATAAARAPSPAVLSWWLDTGLPVDDSACALAAVSAARWPTVTLLAARRGVVAPALVSVAVLADRPDLLLLATTAGHPVTRVDLELAATGDRTAILRTVYENGLAALDPCLTEVAQSCGHTRSTSFLSTVAGLPYPRQPGQRLII
jgi:hypothetical protein